MIPETKFEHWAIVELLGHQKIAGFCTEQPIAGTNMLRVDVPETDKQPAFTRLVGGNSIYAINPVDEATARVIISRINSKPITAYDAIEALKKFSPTAALLIEKAQEEKEYQQEEDDYNM